ncbi:MAG: NAD(P)/FAD-dependent oxidoreductase [Phycisphaerae bacterium]|nr:NAD(P)/FAD-dependent oxidoreductase [Phycisphaerae bacterium]
MKTGICVIGAGPAGLMAAIHAAAGQTPTWVVEANAAAGRKLLLTGGGRCNFTHAADPRELANAFGKAGRFLRHSLYEFSPNEVRKFFRSRGLADAVEPDGCVFPAHRGAADVRDILANEAQKLGTHFRYRARVRTIAADDEGFRIDTESRKVLAERVILATGGVSWPQTGSQGDGYTFAAQLGHTVVPPKPALVPLVTRETWPQELAGISLSGVRLWATVHGRKLATAGNMLFTCNGIGGPAVLDLSRLLADDLGEKGAGIDIGIDALPALDPSQLDQRLQQEGRTHSKKAIANILSELVPRQFARIVCRLAQCDGDSQAGQLSAEKRRQLVRVLKSLPLCVTGTEPIAKATVTHGGVSREEIDPRTMESKIRPGLFFAGEVIDLDGPCGGYNLQMCWSTGALAGRSAARTLLSKDAST